MKVKLLVSRSGIKFSQNVGDEVEVEKEEAVRMIKAGQAVAVKGKPETADSKNTKETR